MKRTQVFAATLLIVLAALAVAAQLPTKQVLTLNAAKKIVAVAEADAKKRGATVVIAVVDEVATCWCSNGWTTRRSPASTSESRRLGRQQFFAAPAKCLRIR